MMAVRSNQPTRVRAVRTIEYAETPRGPSKFFASMEGQGDEIRVYRTVQQCREKHPYASVRLTDMVEHLYEPVQS